MGFDGQTILITGGTGSFGQKLVHTLLTQHHPKKIIIFSRDELKQSEMQKGYGDHGDHPVLRFFIGDVRDSQRLHTAFNGVDVVVHAAALKQVPTLEYNPFEAIKTNVLGAQNIIEQAIERNVKRVIALSTDKAVNATNLYGATKFCSEKLFIQGNAYVGQAATRFSCVRYGNVVGSRGSVVPLLLSQRASGTITITDPRMTRFWIGLEEGVAFVIRCLEQMNGGEIFVPKIPSMRMPDLAKAIAPDCKVKIIGIRPGEKMHEILVSEDENRLTADMKDMYVIHPAHPSWPMKTWKGVTKIPDSFEYKSDTNDQWLTEKDIQTMIAKIEPALKPS